MKSVRSCRWPSSKTLEVGPGEIRDDLAVTIEDAGVDGDRVDAAPEDRLLLGRGRHRQSSERRGDECVSKHDRLPSDG